MGLQHSIDGGDRVVRLTYSGAVSFEDWAAAMDTILGSPEYRPGFRFLLDRRLALPPDVQYVKRVVDFVRQRRRRMADSRWAVVASNSATFTMARFGQDIATGLVKETRVFKDLAEAETWLLSD